MSLLIAFSILICCLLGLFSYGSKLCMLNIGFPEVCKTLLKIQNVFNWVLCIFLMVGAIISFYNEDFLMFFILIFFVQIIANGIYAIVIAFWTRNKRRKIIIDLMRSFIEHYNYKTLDNYELAKKFCLEYQNFGTKEVLRVVCCKRFILK